MNKLKIDDYLEINEQTLIAKKALKVFIDSNQYEFVDNGNYILLPGFFNITTDLGVIPIYLSFSIKLFKPKIIEQNDEKKSLFSYNYEPGEIIMSQDFYEDTTDVSFISKGFEGGMSFFTPVELCETIKNNYYKTFGGVSSVHFEVILAYTYRDPKNMSIRMGLMEDPMKGYNCGLSKTIVQSSSLQALGYNNVSQALTNAILSKSNEEISPIEKIMINT